MCSSDVLIKLIDFWTHPEHFVNTFWTCSVFYIFAHVLLNVLICSKQNTSAILVFWICSRSVLWTAYVFRTCSNDVLMKLIALWTHHEHILNMFWTRSEHVICSALFAVYSDNHAFPYPTPCCLTLPSMWKKSHKGVKPSTILTHTTQWYYTSTKVLLYNNNINIVGETRESWATRRVEPPLLFSKLATYLTCSSYNKCIISFPSNNCFTILIHAISFMLPP